MLNVSFCNVTAIFVLYSLNIFERPCGIFFGGNKLFKSKNYSHSTTCRWYDIWFMQPCTLWINMNKIKRVHIVWKQQ